MKKTRIASWNIAGGRTVRSTEFFDYEPENLEYFSKLLNKLKPDIVCIQENHFKGSYSIAAELGKRINLGNIYDVSLSPSHIAKDFRLGMTILSDKNLAEKKLIRYPYPAFDLLFPDGRKAARHDKGLLVAKYDSFYIGCTQLQPLGFFGHSYKNADGAVLASQVEELFLKNLKTPLIVCGDFSENFRENGLKKVFGEFFAKFNLKNALPDKTTRPLKNGEKTIADFILYTDNFRLVGSQVLKTRTDHYLCLADFEYD